MHVVANCRYPLISELKELYRKAFYGGQPPASLRGVTLKKRPAVLKQVKGRVFPEEGGAALFVRDDDTVSDGTPGYRYTDTAEEACRNRVYSVLTIPPAYTGSLAGRRETYPGERPAQEFLHHDHPAKRKNQRMLSSTL